MLDKITPITFTYNEAPNIKRMLERLTWAREVVVVDSFSGDETLEIMKQFPMTRVFQRKFDSFANQFNYGLEETNIGTEWVLVLDADYMLGDELIRELETLHPPAGVAGYQCHFIYSVFGRPLRSNVYPSRIVLFRKAIGHYLEDGHAQKLSIKGEVSKLNSALIHDDRKPFHRWINSQVRYAQLEAKKLRNFSFRELSWPDRIRKMRVVAPPAMFFYCLVVKGLILDGWRGLYYSFQRMVAELLLSLRLIERDLQRLSRSNSP